MRQLACISKLGSYARVNIAATHAGYVFERSTVQRRDNLTLQVGSGTQSWHPHLVSILMLQIPSNWGDHGLKVAWSTIEEETFESILSLTAPLSAGSKKW